MKDYSYKFALKQKRGQKFDLLPLLIIFFMDTFATLYIHTMTFADFVKSLPKQNDRAINRFIDFVKKDVHFPSTSEPSKLAIYLYKQLNLEQTTAFQKLLLFYGTIPNNRLPKKCKDHEMMLMAVNIIVGLQNFDEDYPYN